MSEIEKLIQEIARLSGLETSDVSMFSDDELMDAISALNCEPLPGPIFTQEQLDQTDGCEQANDLPPIPEEPIIESDFKGGEEAAKCKEKVDTLNIELKKELKEYTDLNILLERLIEYQDNYNVMGAYYEERSKTMALLLNRYQPILIHIRNLEAEIVSLNKKIEIETARRNSYLSVDNYNETAAAAAQSNIDRFNIQIDEKTEEISENKQIRDDLTEKEPVINNNDISGIISSGNSNAGNEFISDVKNILNENGFKNINDSINNYSEFMSVNRTKLPISSGSVGISSVIEQPLIEFNLDFPNLDIMNLDDDVYNEETGARSITNRIFPIKNNPFLKVNDFFKSLKGFNVNNTIVTEIRQTGDALYGGYYYKLSDPLERMFTPADKGLTTSVSGLDPNLVGSGIETKREASTEYYIGDLNKMQNFYKEFEIIFDNKKAELRDTIVIPAFKRVSANMRKLGELDVRIYLSAGNINMDIIDESNDLKTIIDSIEQQQTTFLTRKGQLEDEIVRIRERLEELKPTPENVKKRLIKLDAKCFTDESQPEPSDCTGKEKLGIDPFYDSTIDGIDATLPEPSRLCYWKEFTKIINTMGLLPIPDTPAQFRYWPVGIVIPSPVPVKIPLPIIWQPIIAVSSPFGVIVTFITINGLFISPVVFFASSSGFKQHILTVKGPSKKFGYEPGEEVKKTISIPLATLAAKEKILNAGKDSIALSTTEKKKEHRTRRENLILKLTEANADGKTNKANRIQKRLDDLDKSVENKGPLEQMSGIIDKAESIDDVMKGTKNSILQRIEELRVPEMKNINVLKEVYDKRRTNLNNSLTAALEANDIEEVKKIRKKLENDGLSLEEKQQAVKKDILDFYDKLKLPKIQIPKDKSKIEPKESALLSFKSNIIDYLSDFKFDLVPIENRNVRNILMKNISKVKDDIDLSDFQLNPIGKIDINLNTGKIKDKFKKMTSNLFDKAMGKDNGDDINILQSDRDQKQDILDKETNVEKQKELKKEIRSLDRRIFNSKDNKFIRESYAVDASVLTSISEFKIDYNPFRPCCAGKEADINLGSLPTITLGLFVAAREIINAHIDNLSDETVINLFGGVTFISPEVIKDAFFNIVSSIIPRDLVLPVGLNLTSLATSFLGILGTLTEPKAPIQVQAPLSLHKQITLNTNIIKEPIKQALSEVIDKFILTLPIDLETNFIQINGEDIKAALKQYIVDAINDFKSVIAPIYNAINIAKSAKGANLNIIEGSMHDIAPYGTPIKLAFNAKTLGKMFAPTSATFKLTDLTALAAALPLIQKVIRPIFDNPIPHVVVGASIMAKQQDTLRLLHPIMNSDDIPPWERLSKKNFLLLLFIDEFISEAAEKLGFFRQYL